MSHKVTLWLGRKYGNTLPMYFVSGYPRSGTTWFSELLALYLNLPRPRHYVLPVSFSSVIQTHSEPIEDLNNIFYIYRDGRDALTSLFFYYARKVIENQGSIASLRLKKVFNADLSFDNMRIYLPRFLEHEFKMPTATRSHWGAHVLKWKEASYKQDVVLVRYESLLSNPLDTFTNALCSSLDQVNQEIVRGAVKMQSYNLQVQRPTSQHRTFLRKGVAGNWKDYWDKECGEIFNFYAGDALIQMGYEHNRDWIRNI